MNKASTAEDSVINKRMLSHSPDKVWRALTQSYLIEDWLMTNDFKLEIGHIFTLQFDWGTVECKVIDFEINEKLIYTWSSGSLQSTVTWLLTPTKDGQTELVMEQVGFPEGQPRFYQGAQMGWPIFFNALEKTLANMNERN